MDIHRLRRGRCGSAVEDRRPRYHKFQSRQGTFWEKKPSLRRWPVNFCSGGSQVAFRLSCLSKFARPRIILVFLTKCFILMAPSGTTVRIFLTMPMAPLLVLPCHTSLPGVFNPIWRSRGDKLSLEEVWRCWVEWRVSNLIRVTALSAREI